MKKYKLYILFLITLIFSTLVSVGTFKSAKYFLTDELLSKGAKNSDDIIIVAIDDESVNRIGQFPWDRTIYSDSIYTINENGADIIGFDISFSEYVKSEDEVLSGAIKKYNNIILSSKAILSDSLDEHGALIASHIYSPNDRLMLSKPAVGFNSFATDVDSIYRRALPYVYDSENKIYKSSFSYRIYLNYCLKNDIEPVNLPLSYYQRPYIRYMDENDSIPIIPFYKVIENDFPKDFFKNKIVLIGMMQQNGYGEHYTINGPVFDVEIHASFINNLLEEELYYDIFDDQRVYFGHSKYLSLSTFFWIFINSLLYILMVMSVDNNDFKIIGSFWMIIVYLLVQFTIFQEGYIIDFTYPIIILLIMCFVDLIIDFNDSRVEKRKITDIVNTYMSDRVIDKIVNDKDETISLGGEEKDVTVMFIDIRGFTSFTENVRPNECVEALNEYLSMITDVISKYGGLLDKYLGDGVMAIYNAPYDLKNHEYICVMTATEIIKESIEVNKHIYEKYNIELSLGIGINTGRAIVGNVGSEHRMSYTAIGDTVNIASRLETDAKKGQVLITEDVFKKIEKRFITRNLGARKLRGKEKPILVYEVLDII